MNDRQPGSPKRLQLKEPLMYRYITDPGHGWVEVTREEIDRLGIGPRVSGYSYTDGARVYLEEDCDAALFVRAKKDRGEPVDFVEVYQERTPIRAMRGWA